MNRDEAIDTVRAIKANHLWTVEQDMACCALGLDPDNYRANHTEGWPEHMRGKSMCHGVEILEHMAKIEKVSPRG